jgi:MAP/microtubule affinity-regulating kinase
MNPNANASEAFAEAETLKSLDHKNIVRLYDCIPSKTMKIVFIMEYLKGGELLDYVTKKGKLPEEEAKGYFKQIAEAMLYCHERKIVHRDLKLENVMLVDVDSKECKIVDFGIAGLGAGVGSKKAETGTLRYMPPELLMNQSLMPHPSQDIWALGVILYGMLCGSLPFDAESEKEMLALVKEGIKYPKDVSGLSNEVKDLIAKMFTWDANARLKTIDVCYHPWLLGHKLPPPKSVGFEETKVRAEEKKDPKGEKGPTLKISAVVGGGSSKSMLPKTSPIPKKTVPTKDPLGMSHPLALVSPS